MNARFDLILVALSCTVPTFFAGWFCSHDPLPRNQEPVRKVIEAIGSEARPAQTRLQAAAVFDSLHNRTVTSFVNTFKNFGMSRVLSVDDMRHTDLWTLHPGRKDGFEVSLIGLDRETPVRFFSSAPPAAPAEAGGNAAELLKLLSTDPSAPVPAEELPLEEMDLAAVDALRKSNDVRREIFTEHDSVIGYGPIRSSAECLQCHDGDAGDLLGVFRYTFPIPERPLRMELAGTP